MSLTSTHANWKTMFVRIEWAGEIFGRLVQTQVMVSIVLREVPLGVSPMRMS